jgi:hypothetical protein
MTIANLKAYGDKGTSFNYRLRVLKLLSRISQNTSVQSTPQITMLGVTGDMLLGAIPAGYELEQVIVNEVGGANVTINIGTTIGGSEILANEGITASNSNVLVLNYTNDPGLNSFSVYISSLAWGTSNLNITLLLRKIV